MTTLISFLGKSRKNSATGYQRASYQFADGQVVHTTFFGAALMQRLRPQRTLLLGTAGSMWDVLDIDVESDEWSELGEAAERGDVTQSLLDRTSACKRGAMLGAELVLIPYCRDETEQTLLLSDMAARVAEGEHVVLDITHGFRHLPMLALVAARYLAHVRKAVVIDIYYGALDMTAQGITPVVKLDGLLRMLDWIEAFAAHDASGNYAGFATLLQHDGMEAKEADQLAHAAHLERVTNSAEARAKITPLLGSIEHLGGATRLFAAELGQRLAWARKDRRDAREWELFEAYLARKDFIRAAIYLQESVVSAACFGERLDGNDHIQRETARERLKDRAEFRALSDIRNMLAHGTASGNQSERAKAAATSTASAASLATELRRLAKPLAQIAAKSKSG